MSDDVKLFVVGRVVCEYYSIKASSFPDAVDILESAVPVPKPFAVEIVGHDNVPLDVAFPDREEFMNE